MSRKAAKKPQRVNGSVKAKSHGDDHRLILLHSLPPSSASKGPFLLRLSVSGAHLKRAEFELRLGATGSRPIRSHRTVWTIESARGLTESMQVLTEAKIRTVFGPTQKAEMNVIYQMTLKTSLDKLLKINEAGVMELADIQDLKVRGPIPSKLLLMLRTINQNHRFQRLPCKPLQIYRAICLALIVAV